VAEILFTKFLQLISELILLKLELALIVLLNRSIKCHFEWFKYIYRQLI